MKCYVKKTLINGENQIVITTVSKEVGNSLYNNTVLKGDPFIELELVDKETAKSRRQEKMYRASLKVMADFLSDVDKKWMPEDVHTYVKKQFCKYKLGEGVDLFNYYHEKDDNGKIIELREPKSFNSRINGKLFSEYVSFYERFCESRWNINPLEDAKEKYRLNNLRVKEDEDIEHNLYQGW